MPTITKPCHNCRRRRLRCDRSWPSCHKCAVSGQECLGYGRVFVWTQTIDPHGNLKPPAAASSSSSSSSVSSSSTSSVSSSSPWCPAPTLNHRKLPPKHAMQQPFRPPPTPETDHPSQLSPPPRARDAPQPGRDDSSGPAPDECPRRVLIGNPRDPVFQDLDWNSRYYLCHFADRHPLLLHILIATSALHWVNISRPLISIHTGLADLGGRLVQLRATDLVLRKALVDAFTAKQKAICHLRGVLDALDPAVSEVALAAVHFFVKFDLIDLERHEDRAWRTHLEGASSILAFLSPGRVASSSSRLLRDTVVADCFIYHILGSTLASGALAARIARYAFELLPVMKRVEANSYLSCPAEILQVILAASQLSYETRCTDWSLSAADKALKLVCQALAFDIPGWAARLRQQSAEVPDMESRVHVASAHRSAACLYILQVMPPVRATPPVDAELLVSDILGHLAQIGNDDPYFKATSWPAFIAGVETREAEKRTWTLKRLLAIWGICSWGYIFAAIEMLNATWAMQDRADGGEDGAALRSDVNWLQGLKDMGFDCLIV
ncbi:hypothetical protein XA68_17610 [Ophiocordyceps unilateralis]|uniref:Zn(2)-C6 fungal-type domain-containing protein n=1 Tax=Ophiocordyceps unilateralis TaxID=268505 RepID=A0A2A9P4B4_OPHUN|nr:hypothetical protein XA68_17610 [Ophiocordyceps unilateralis]